MAVPDAALRTVEEYCAARLPEGLEDEFRIECSLRGRAITIVERQPPWNPELGSEWSEVKVAQLRYDDERKTWARHAADRNGLWFALTTSDRPVTWRLC